MIGLKNRNCRPAAILALLSALLFVKGLYMGGLQFVIGDISDSFGMQITGIGILVSVPHILSVLLPTPVGILSDKVGKKAVLIIASVVFAAGCVLACLCKDITLYIIASILIVGSGSVCESVATAVLSDANPKEAARYINISQCVLSAGAVLSPIGMQMLMDAADASWRWLFVICGAALLVLLFFLVVSAFPAAQVAAREDKREGEKAHFFRDVIFVCALISMALYISLEHGVGFFTETFFDHGLGRSDLGAYALSLYWVGMTVSRLIFSVRLKKLRTVLLIHFAATTALFAILTFSNTAYLCLILCGLVGFAYGPIWSALVALGTRQFPEHSGSVSGFMMSAGALGSIISPTLMGLVSDWFDIRAGFLLLSVFALLGAVLSLISKKYKIPTKTT